MSSSAQFRKKIQQILAALIIMILSGPVLGYLIHVIFNTSLTDCIIVAYALGFVSSIYWIRSKQ